MATLPIYSPSGGAIIPQNGVAGTPAECVATLARYADVGVERVYLQTLDLDDTDHVELVAAEVASQFR